MSDHRCSCENCGCHKNSNAVSIVAYDMSGAPLDPIALSSLERTIQSFAAEQRLVLCVTRN